MQEPRTPSPTGIWLALSGGGMRAALFHYGAIKRLYELGLLQEVTAISATSGGAIIAALIGLHGPFTEDEPDNWLTFEKSLLTAAIRGLLGPTMWSFIAWICLILSVSIGLINLGLTISIGEMPLLNHLFLAAFSLCVISISIVAIGMRHLQKNEGFAPQSQLQPEIFPDPQSIMELKIGWVERIKILFNALLIQFDPGYVRWYFLNRYLFNDASMTDFKNIPKIFLCASDLKNSREIVFSSKLIGEISVKGARRLWRQHRFDIANEEKLYATVQGENVPVATCVAASSALPPIFTAVPVFVEGELVANCIDGGVIDNNALNITRQMAKYADEDHADSRGRTFANTIGHVLAIDAAPPIVSDNRYFWLRSSTMLRISDLLHNRQIHGFLEDLSDIQHLFKVSARAIALTIKPDETSELGDPLIAMRAAKIRTHFDRFSRIECAVLAYLGYYWANKWAFSEYADRRTIIEKIPFRTIENILPEEFAPEKGALEENNILNHLKYSHLKLSFCRWLLRSWRSLSLHI